MDKKLAAQVLDTLVRECGQHDYPYWRARVGADPTTFMRMVGATSFQGEINAVWDNRPGGAIRVLCSVDDGGLRALAPLTADLLIDP